MNQQKPDKIGKYDVLDVLGRGGMGVVYRARDSRLGRIVAIKMLTESFSENSEMLQRFYREASQTGALRHNNIVIVYDAGDQDGEPYIVMEFVEGEPLDKVIKRERIHLQLTMSIVEQVCSALAYAHRAGVIHRDIKPANVILRADDSVKLLDFGIARDDNRVDTSLTSTGSLVGTPPYMAPERFRGAAIDGRSDIFSAGVLLYVLLTGRLPFDADYPAVIDQILRSDPTPPSQLVAECPVHLDAIVARALAKSPADRYANADDMAMDLHEVSAEITRARIAELLAGAEKCFAENDFVTAQGDLKALLRLDPQHVAGKRLLSQVEQRLTQREKERRAQELARMAQLATSEREWDRALALCEEALTLNPASNTVVNLRKSAIDGKQTQEKVAQLLAESVNARKVGELTRAQARAALAKQLDPQNSQILALCRQLQQEIDEKRSKEELRTVMASAREHLVAREFEEAFVLLDRAAAIAPDNAEVLRAREELSIALIEEKRKSVVRRLEERAALTTTVEKLRIVSNDLTQALREFPNDPALLRMRMHLEPRIKQLEDEQFVREVSKAATEMPAQEALERVRAALMHVPASEQLHSLEASLCERIERSAREQLLTQRLGQARQAIDDCLYLEAIKILERTQAEGFSSYEVEGLLELAKSAASQRISQELLERTYSQAKKLIDEEDYESAVPLLRSALRQINEPVLRRQLEEAERKQVGVGQRAESVLAQAEKLISMELFPEAILILEEQSPGVKRLPRVGQAFSQAVKLQQADESFALLTGRCYAQIGTAAGLGDLKAALGTQFSTEEAASMGSMQKQLRQRCEQLYAEKASSAIAAARDLLGRDDSVGAEALLKETAPWLELAPASAQEEVRALEVQAAAARKVLRFRRGSWR